MRTKFKHPHLLEATTSIAFRSGTDMKEKFNWNLGPEIVELTIRDVEEFAGFTNVSVGKLNRKIKTKRCRHEVFCFDDLLLEAFKDVIRRRFSVQDFQQSFYDHFAGSWLIL